VLNTSTSGPKAAIIFVYRFTYSLMKREVIFDVETKKLFSDIKGDNPADLGVSIVSTYSRELSDSLSEESGKMESFWEADFDKMWPLFQNADRIIGFNSIGFDVPALQPYCNFPFGKLHHFDIMLKFKEEFGKRISLDAIAKETLDREKIDTGLNAVYYWSKGDKESLAKLKKYCEDDVKITKDIYDYVLQNKHLLFKDKWNTLRKVDLDFSYLEEEKTENQIGLF
jgi:DEAD/DEAH box helicase domain-containing protein